MVDEHPGDAGNPAKPVRDEDSFDVEAVAAWLGRGPVTGVRQFAGGASNLTYLLTLAQGPDLILRRPPVGAKAKGKDKDKDKKEQKGRASKQAQSKARALKPDDAAARREKLAEAAERRAAALAAASSSQKFH